MDNKVTSELAGHLDDEGALDLVPGLAPSMNAKVHSDFSAAGRLKPSWLTVLHPLNC
jgi:hypothetical protein